MWTPCTFSAHIESAVECLQINIYLGAKTNNYVSLYAIKNIGRGSDLFIYSLHNYAVNKKQSIKIIVLLIGPYRIYICIAYLRKRRYSPIIVYKKCIYGYIKYSSICYINIGRFSVYFNLQY